MKIPKQRHKGPQGSQPRRRSTQGAVKRNAVGNDATAGNSVPTASLDRSGVKAQYRKNTRLISRTAQRRFKGGVHHNNPPVITGPDDAVVQVGDPAEFTVSATGTGTLNYRWEVAGPSGSWRPIPDAPNDDTLTFTSAQWQDGGLVRCRVTDANGVAHSREALLLVIETPTIDTQPTDASVTEPESAEFTVEASHSGGEPLYLWQADEGGDSWVNAGNVLSDASGMTTDTLTCATTDTTVDDGVAIRCRLRPPNNDANQETYTNVVGLTVDPDLPVITTPPADATVTEPAGTTFTIEATHTSGSLYYHWQANDGGGWEDADTVLTTGDIDEDTLTVTSTAVADSGVEVRCRVRGGSNTNARQVNSATATLTVNAP